MASHSRDVMAKKRDKKRKKHEEPELPGDIWIEGHRLNEKTGKLEPVRYKLKVKNK